MGKAKHKYPKVKRIEVEEPEVRDFLKRVKDPGLLEEDYEIIQGMAETIQCLTRALDDNAVSIKRLLRYLLGAPTETAKNLFPKNNSKKAMPAQGERKAKPQRPWATWRGELHRRLPGEG